MSTQVDVKAPLRMFLIQMLQELLAEGVPATTRFAIYDSGNTYTLQVNLIGISNPQISDETGETARMSGRAEP